ncbi:hypothetical protein ABZS76_37740 [Streptomyces sp. NPDC005562]|uniref:hypothetical protein n=1 Tax=unclassified Streptomyces TaxID=2593676 RepID=UPI0033B33E2C
MHTTTGTPHRSGSRLVGAASRIPTGVCPPNAGAREGLRVGEYGAGGAVPPAVTVRGGTAW